jgi:hypothetical protein
MWIPDGMHDPLPGSDARKKQIAMASSKNSEP